jgi:hypothetical protein
MFLGFNKFLLVKYIPGYKDILTQYYLLFLFFQSGGAIHEFSDSQFGK